jgi:hypothetical protein
MSTTLVMMRRLLIKMRIINLLSFIKFDQLASGDFDFHLL